MKHTPDQILGALREKVGVNKQHGYLEWLHSGRGPSMRRGDPVVGDYITVLGHRIQYRRAAWMLLTGQALSGDQVLDTSLNETDYRQWRVISKAVHGRAVAKARESGSDRLVFTGWIDYTGKVRRLPKTQRAESDSGWEKPYTEKRAA